MKYILIIPIFILSYIPSFSQQLAFISKEPSVVMFNIANTDSSITFKSETVKKYTPIKSGSYNISVFNRENKKVYLTLYRNSKFLNRIEGFGTVTFFIVSLNPSDTVQINVE